MSGHLFLHPPSPSVSVVVSFLSLFFEGGGRFVTWQRTRDVY